MSLGLLGMIALVVLLERSVARHEALAARHRGRTWLAAVGRLLYGPAPRGEDRLGHGRGTMP
jgi:hypothetical protein